MLQLSSNVVVKTYPPQMDYKPHEEEEDDCIRYHMFIPYGRFPTYDSEQFNRESGRILKLAGGP